MEQRDSNLAIPLKMSDGLAANNVPQETIDGNCLSHGRRKFIEIESAFPEEAKVVIQYIAQIYKNDHTVKQQSMTDENRMRYHQQHSKPIVDELYQWLNQQISEKKAEPNSGVGTAIQYMLKRWDKLTKFLTVPGMPLDNNIAERAVRIMVRHRVASFFFRTEHSARISNILISLIYTCRMNKVNPLEYLNALQRNKSALFKHPENWLPWNYREQLEIEVAA